MPGKSKIVIEGIEHAVKPLAEVLGLQEAKAAGKSALEGAEHVVPATVDDAAKAAREAAAEVHPVPTGSPANTVADSAVDAVGASERSAVEEAAQGIPSAADNAAEAVPEAIAPESDLGGLQIPDSIDTSKIPDNMLDSALEPVEPQRFFDRNGVDLNDLTTETIDLIKNGSTFEDATSEVWANIGKRHLTEDATTINDAYSHYLQETLNKARGDFPGGIKPISVEMEAVNAFKNLMAANGVNQVDSALTYSRSMAKDAETWAVKVKGMQMAVTDTTQKLGELARKVADGIGGHADRLEMLYWLDKYGDLMADFLAVNAGLGRGLRILGQDFTPAMLSRSTGDLSQQITKVSGVKELLERSGLGRALVEGSRKGAEVSDIIGAAVRGGHITVEDLNQIIQVNGGVRKLDNMSRLVAAAGGDATKLRNIMNSNLAIDVINEIHVNALLSGPPSAIVDLVATAGKTFLLPGEKILGGMLTMDKNAINEGIAYYVALSNGYKEAFNFAISALRSGKPILDTMFGAMEHYQASITSARFGTKPGMFSDAIDALGNAVRLPSRLRMTSDEFYKQWNYRAFATVELTKLGQSRNITGTALGEFVQTGLNSLSSPILLKNTDPAIRDLYLKALGYAREATFQRPLEGIWADGASFLNRHPITKLFIPFVRTPMNLVRDVVIRTSPPLEMLRKDLWKDATSAGAAKRADVVGRLATGSLLWGSAIALAVEGKITGAGPQAKGEKALKRGDGWQPYSVVINNSDGTKTYIKYSRLDPFSTFFSLAADYVETANNTDDATKSELAAAMLMTTAHNLSSKTYLLTVGQLLEAITNPQQKGSQFLGNFFSSFVPALGNSIPTDPYIHETRGMMDAVMAKIPGLSNVLPPKYDALGEPIKNVNAIGMNFINPFTSTESSKDSVRSELGRLSPNLGTVSAVEQGEDLRNYTNTEGRSAYERLNDHLRSTPVNGMTMKETLADLFNSAEYKSLPDADPETGRESGRAALIRRVLGHYRSYAREQTHAEFPELSTKLKLIAAQRARATTPMMISGNRYSDIYPAN